MRRLEPEVRERVIAKIEQYASDPTSLAHQVTALSGRECLRMRIDAYRVIFNVEREDPAIMVIRGVLRRRESSD